MYSTKAEKALGLFCISSYLEQCSSDQNTLVSCLTERIDERHMSLQLGQKDKSTGLTQQNTSVLYAFTTYVVQPATWPLSLVRKISTQRVKNIKIVCKVEFEFLHLLFHKIVSNFEIQLNGNIVFQILFCFNSNCTMAKSRGNRDKG